MQICKICAHQHTGCNILVAERMYGTNENFEYFQCDVCKCMQIAKIPEDLSKFYPQVSYYSLNPKSKVKQIVRRCVLAVDSPYAKSSRILAKIVGTVVKKLKGPSHLIHWLKNGEVKKGAKILDVGCGAGVFIYDLQEEDLSRIDGVDPNISSEIVISNKSKILKGDLSDIQEKYDFVMLNHSLEHIPNQTEVFKGIRKILNPKGTLLIRIPLIDSKNWEDFGIDWVNFDAPRHLFLHSKKSIEILAKNNGFKLEKTEFDGDAFGIWGSLLYKQNKPLVDTNSYIQTKPAQFFKKPQLKQFELETREQNLKQIADQACFYFKPEY